MEVLKKWYGTIYKLENGINVRVNSNGDDGYEIVIGHDGACFASSVKEEPNTSNIKALAMAAAKGDFEDIQRCYNEVMKKLKDDE